MIPFEFRHDLWLQKTRIMGLSCGVVCVILRLAVLIQYRSVTDRHTDTHTHTHRHTTTANTALSIASRGKNCLINHINGDLLIECIMLHYCLVHVICQLFKLMRSSSHCLHHLLPPVPSVSYSLRKCGHPHELLEHKYQKN